MYEKVECPECRVQMGIDEVTPLRYVLDLNERLDEGSEVPAGECRRCKSLVYVVKEFDPPVLAAKFARIISVLVDLMGTDPMWKDVATESGISEDEVLEIVQTATKMWEKVRWIYEQEGTKSGRFKTT